MKEEASRREALQVVTREAMIVLVDESGQAVWEGADEARLVNRLFQFKVAEEAISALQETTKRLLSREGQQPQQRSREERMAERNNWIVARSIPTPSELRALLQRDRQPKLWERAA